MPAISRTVKEKFPHLFYWLYGLKSRRYKQLTASEIFTEKFIQSSWHGDESLSGPGSSLENTRIVRQRLPDLLQSLEAQRILDIPCGDYYWMNLIELPVKEYIGADIVEALIIENQRKYAKPGREFRVIDILIDPLPRVDVIFCRDCLVHFSYSDIWCALKQMKVSGSTYLITTTYPGKSQNVDILTGQWRPLNLQHPPFLFPSPSQLILEESTEQDGFCADKSLGVWALNELSSL